MASCGVSPKGSSSSSANDELLARGVREGDDRAFELLYERHWRGLSHYAGRLLRDPSAGEDAAQVALANAYRALRSGQTPRSVRPWLYRIARNAAWGQRAKGGEALELPSNLESGAVQADDAASLNAAVARLPERQRAVFALRELRGASNRETADLLGLRESQVEQLLFAGRARLAELLVFGDSVSCEAVRAAGTARLGRHERRAFKRHAHHCAGCRELLGGRLRLGARLLAPVEALRRLVELAVSASAPAKAGAAAAIAVAAATPVVVPAVRSHDEPVAGRSQPAITAPAQPEPAALPQARQPAAPVPAASSQPTVRIPARMAGTTTVQPAPVSTLAPVPTPTISATPPAAPTVTADVAPARADPVAAEPRAAPAATQRRDTPATSSTPEGRPWIAERPTAPARQNEPQPRAAAEPVERRPPAARTATPPPRAVRPVVTPSAPRPTAPVVIPPQDAPAATAPAETPLEEPERPSRG